MFSDPVLQQWFLLEVPQLIGGVAVDLHKVLDLGLDGCRVGQVTPSQWALPGGHDRKVNCGIFY